MRQTAAQIAAQHLGGIQNSLATHVNTSNHGPAGPGSRKAEGSQAFINGLPPQQNIAPNELSAANTISEKNHGPAGLGASHYVELPGATAP
jgi:hypothetical protein